MNAELLCRYTDLRRRIHGRPELGFDEHQTASLVAEHLRGLRLEVATGIGKTGVVASVRKGNSSRAIGLRADMDALPLQELNTFSHRSQIDGRFHACGHDGHTAMLLAAAEYLAGAAQFDGTVHLIFQPAEEGLGGARAMIDDGLFKRFPCDEIYGMHNMPGIAPGEFAVRSGSFFAGADSFRLTVRGRGGHAAMPHLTVDPVVVSAHIVTALQTLVSRNADPLKAAVVTVGELKAGSAYNIIPETAELRGTLRFLDRELAKLLRERFKKVVDNVAAAFDATAELECWNSFPVLVNRAAQTDNVVRAARATVGAGKVQADAVPIMGSEDFASMLEEIPGCYVLIGNGTGTGACMLHNPRYDFNDSIIPTGVHYWVQLVDQILGRPEPRHA